MTTMFEPDVGLATQLIYSIPKKVGAWLELLGADFSEPFNFGPLEFEMTFNMITDDLGGKITLKEEELIIIEWAGDFKNPRKISISSMCLVRADVNLYEFTKLERSIYDCLQEYQDKTDAHISKYAGDTDDIGWVTNAQKEIKKKN